VKVLVIAKNMTIYTKDTESEAKAKVAKQTGISVEELEALASFGSGKKLPIPEKWIYKQLKYIGTAVEDCCVQLRKMNTQAVISFAVQSPSIPMGPLADIIEDPFTLVMAVAIESESVEAKPDVPFSTPVENTKGLTEDPNAPLGCVFVDIFGAKDLGNAKMKELVEIISPYVKVTTVGPPGTPQNFPGLKTKSLSDTFNPVWNERLRIPAPNGKLPATIMIKVRTVRAMSGDEDLAFIEISPQNLVHGPMAQQGFPLTRGNAINPNTQIFLAFSYDAQARPWRLTAKASSDSGILKKFTQGASSLRKNVLRDCTKWLVLATRLGTVGFKQRDWVGGVVSSISMGVIRMSCYSSGEMIVPDAVVKAEEQNSFVKTLKKAIVKVYGVIEIACYECKRQKQEGSIGIGLSVAIPGVPIIDPSMTMIFDIVTSYVVSKGEAYLKSAAARTIFDGALL